MAYRYTLKILMFGSLEISIRHYLYALWTILFSTILWMKRVKADRDNCEKYFG